MTENKTLTGEVVKVELIHVGEGWPCTEITIRINHRAQPYRPEGYVHTWRELKEQQEPFTEYELERFARYEKEKQEYEAFTVNLWSLHLGGLLISQED
jgi:hypothetical protein